MNGRLHKTPYFGRSIRRQTGLSLMEILVSVLVLSIGLLGIAGMQGTSLKSTRSASLRTQAIILTQDIIESMHANRVVALNDGTNFSANFSQTFTTPGTDCIATDCTPAELAQFDRYQWWLKIYDTGDSNNQSKFPQGRGEIVIADTGLVTVSIKWLDNVKQNIDDPNQATDKITTFSMTTML